MKTVKVKIDRNPEHIFENTHLSDYIYQMEEEHRLKELPEPLLVYYVLKRFLGEILNGGFEQFLLNQYDYTYPFLRLCFEKVSNLQLKRILEEYVITCEESVIEKKITNTESMRKFEELDSQVVLLDEKVDLLQSFKQIYTDLYGKSPRFINIEIDEEKDRLIFFKWNKKGVSLQSALDTFVSFLVKNETMKWDIIIQNLYDSFTINAKSSTSINLDEIMANWLEDKKTHDVMFFKSIRIKNYYKNSHDEILISKSGFEKDEYVLKRQKYSLGIQLEQEYKCWIMLGATNTGLELHVERFRMDDVLEYLKFIIEKHNNINGVILKNISKKTYHRINP